MKPDSKEFLKLQAEWDRVLEKSGFEDIEQRKDGNLKNWSSIISLKHTPVEAEAKYEYYRAAGHFLHEYAFENHVEKRIFELHVDGVSIRDTVKILTKEKLWFVSGGVVYKRRVHEELQRLIKLMMEKIQRENQTSD